MLVLIGSAMYALSLHMFITPNQIAPGGLSGISVIINYLTNLPLGVLYLLLNLPVILLGFKFLGVNFTFKTIISIGLVTLFVDVIFVGLPIFNDDRLLGAILGGALSGSGCAFMLMSGGSSGGTDVTNRIITKKYPYFKMGQITLISNLIVVLLATIVFQDLNTAFYSLISMYLSAQALDMIMYGVDKGKMIMITSDICEEIAQRIRTDTGHTATMLYGQGCYTKEEKNTLMCAVRYNEFYRIKKIVSDVDSAAFIIITDANEIVGKGFKPFTDKS